MRIPAVERLACAIAKRVVIRRRRDVVAELAELGDGRTIDCIGAQDVAVPFTNIGEMGPVPRELMRGIRDVVLDDRGVSVPSTLTERGVPSLMAVAK